MCGATFFCNEQQGVAVRAGLRVEDISRFGTELAVVLVLAEVDQEIFLGFDSSGCEEQDLVACLEFQLGRGAVDVAVHILFHNVVGQHAF